MKEWENERTEGWIDGQREGWENKYRSIERRKEGRDEG
jgi:hypothetical protein